MEFSPYSTSGSEGVRMITMSFLYQCAVLSFVVWNPVLAQTEPLCQNKTCRTGEECRVVETCTQGGQCSVTAVCLPVENSERGGCRIGRPLLELKAGGGFDLRTCYTRKNCGDGFYCSTELQDTSSRCCRATVPEPAPKAGECPVPDDSQTFFCVDQCRSDADCGWDMKCCQKSVSCNRSVCMMPAPCSVKTCGQGEECVETPDRQAVCVPAQPQQPPAQKNDEPLCQNKACGPGEECRAVETCNQQQTFCRVSSVCVPASNSGREGCMIGKPLLQPRVGGGFDLRTCHTRRNCGEGFYCSTALADTSARCCRTTASPPKQGLCPAPDNTRQPFFCADECRSDGDCPWEAKCCQDSNSCSRKRCTPPEPCSLKRCQTGFQCVVNPDFNAECVPAQPQQSPAQKNDEPLCQNKACGPGEECRAVETCNQQQTFCRVSSVCVPASNSGRGGCMIGKPLLQPRVGGGFDLRTCYTRRNCGEGFYCSTALADASARCCRTTASPPKQGLCPAPDNTRQTYFCVDECRSDGDCPWDAKCCQNSNSCSRNKCTPPEPCSLKRCQTGFQCVVNPDFNAECVPVIPPTRRPSPVQVNNNAGPNNNVDDFQALLNSIPDMTCPNPGAPYRRNECTYANQCGTRNPLCPSGQFCCATIQCGNICRWPVPFIKSGWGK